MLSNHTELVDPVVAAVLQNYADAPWVDAKKIIEEIRRALAEEKRGREDAEPE